MGPAVMSSALSADESSSSEAAGEKTEQNDDDIVKSQEVRDVFRICLFRFFQVLKSECLSVLLRKVVLKCF